MKTTKPKKSYRRGNSAHYRSLAEKSQKARINRYISCDVVLDRDVVTKVPHRVRDTDAGYDVCAAEAVKIAPGKMAKIRTGVRVKCPAGYSFILWDRSSWTQRGTTIRNNLIDATYTGPISIWMKNESDVEVTVDVGNKIAQLLFIPQIHVDFKQVVAFVEEDTDRGAKGYGSTGK